MPAGQCRVVVALVVHVPAKDNVAESETAFCRREELVLVQVLAAQHAVDVRNGHLDALSGSLANRVEHLLGGDVLRHAPLQ